MPDAQEEMEEKQVWKSQDENEYEERQEMLGRVVDKVCKSSTNVCRPGWYVREAAVAAARKPRQHQLQQQQSVV